MKIKKTEIKPMKIPYHLNHLLHSEHPGHVEKYISENMKFEETYNFKWDNQYNILIPAGS